MLANGETTSKDPRPVVIGTFTSFLRRNDFSHLSSNSYKMCTLAGGSSKDEFSNMSKVEGALKRTTSMLDIAKDGITTTLW